MEGQDFNYVIKHPVLQKHRDLLWKLTTDRIMCVCLQDKSNVYLMECCDEYFTHDLTKAECLELSELFKELCDAMNEEFEE